jgi:hypothetical protein
MAWRKMYRQLMISSVPTLVMMCGVAAGFGNWYMVAWLGATVPKGNDVRFSR